MSETKSGSFCAVNFDVKIWLNRQWIYWIGCGASRLAAAAINQTHKKGSTFVIESEFLLRTQQPNTYMFTT